jgi:energy-coupling factor transport system permease protein
VAPLLLGAMVGALVAARFETALACVAVGVACTAAAGAGWPRRAWWTTVIVGALMAVAVNAWLVDGTALPWPAVAGRPATREGVRLGALLALRLAGAAVAVHGLRAAWPGTRAADEAARLLRPLERVGFPVHGARAVLGLALRVAPVLRDEARRIERLQGLRAGRAARGWGERLERHRATAVPALVAALERAEQTALALEARHWRSRPLPGPGARAGAVWGWAGAGLAAASLLWRVR